MQAWEPFSFAQESSQKNPTVLKFVHGLLNTSHKLYHDSMLFLCAENIVALNNI